VPQIWFSALQDRYDPASQSVTWNYYDFPAMLSPDAPWQEAAHRLDMMGFNTNHAAEGFSRNGMPSLSAIKAMITRLGVKVSGGGSVVYTDGLCKGAGVEGMTSDNDYAHEVVSTTERWHAAGLPLNYVGMDGPYYFGFIYMQDKCHFTIEEVARRAANTMKKIRDLYPNIMVVDAEGPGKDLPAGWLPGYHRFLAAFRKEYGAPIDCLDMDLHWTDTWNTGYRWTIAATQIANDIHKQGLKVSLIIDADDTKWDPDVAPPDSKTDPRIAMTEDYWMKAVRKHIDLVKQNAIPLDAIDLASWMKFPRKNLPETDPQAWTSVINYAYGVLATSK
jgi:hypothetical protein